MKQLTIPESHVTGLLSRGFMSIQVEPVNIIVNGQPNNPPLPTVTLDEDEVMLVHKSNRKVFGRETGILKLSRKGFDRFKNQLYTLYINSNAMRYPVNSQKEFDDFFYQEIQNVEDATNRFIKSRSTPSISFLGNKMKHFKSYYLNEVYEFAESRFIAEDIRRKYTNEPYMVHPLEVAKIVESVTDDEDMIAAALLHDTVEDTKTTIGEIFTKFRARTAFLTQCLTDVSIKEDGNRLVRKTIELNRLSQVTNDAKTIKVADLISNSRDIHKNDSKFAVIYMKEKKKLIKVLKGADKTLLKECQSIIDNYYKNR